MATKDDFRVMSVEGQLIKAAAWADHVKFLGTLP
jgi:hypothetical protein